MLGFVPQPNLQFSLTEPYWIKSDRCTKGTPKNKLFHIKVVDC
ncbi:hypothetical protein GXM_04045 [Nostoc sphaeroides CCNUC1]|uniref:Uncharacterized protein n=1 Tax=Nostoc sphaeroides CCNUC1 TaxID=2653204 RepID=A0A5P8W1T8_9NOSO|nr:hypothetical protein GXM_04045 [Nostoc sphaeroides CCNUC1]